MSLPEEFDKLSLGEIDGEKVFFKRETMMKQLGIYIKTRDFNGESNKIIDKYGAQILWDWPKIKTIAYRVQKISDRSHPVTLTNQIKQHICSKTYFYSLR